MAADVATFKLFAPSINLWLGIVSFSSRILFIGSEIPFDSFPKTYVASIGRFFLYIEVF